MLTAALSSPALCATLLASTVAAAPAPAAAAAVHRYTVRADESLTTLDVRACFADGLPQHLVADHWLATRATRPFRFVVDGETRFRETDTQVVAFPQPSDDGCIEWRTDLAEIAEVHRMNVGYRAGEALVMTTGSWFWRPYRLTRSRDIEFVFDLPDGMQVSVPWRPLDEAGTRFLHDHSPLEWSALMAIGRLEQYTFGMHGATFRLSIAPGPASLENTRVRPWLENAIQAAATLWNRFPVDNVQLLVVPVAGGYDAAPWAQTTRGGGTGAQFFVNAKAANGTFASDWIATHELVHFALPYVQRNDAWLSEGFASYYQSVLRARAGLLSPEAAWQELYEGFLRGHRNTGYSPLSEDSRHMHARGRTLRVYWSGAAIALLADVALRTQSDNAWSLDRVLREFDHCCREPERSWSARDLFERFDDIAGTNIFATLYNRNVYSRHFPRLEETWVALGIATDGERATLLPTGERLHVRKAIMDHKREEKVAAQDAPPENY